MFQNQLSKNLLLLLLIFTFSNANNYAQTDKSSPQQKQLRDVKMTNIPFKIFLADLARSEKTPMSLVIDLKYDASVSFDVKNATTEDIFDAIVRAKPRYKWEKSNGVVRFFPKNNQNQSLQNLLDTKISKFSIESNTSASTAVAKIFNLTEVKDALLKSNANPFSAKNKYDDRILNPNSSLEFTDLTFRDLLDNIVKESKTKLWSIEFIASQEKGSNDILLEFF